MQKSTIFSKNMQMRKLGMTHLQLSGQGLGCMSMSEFYGKPLDDLEAIELINIAFKNGINMLDTADVYGYGRNEVMLGKAIAKLLSEGVDRKKIIVATKCGILRDENDVTKRGVDNSYHYIKQACSSSLKRLGDEVGHIDLFYIHRIANQGLQIEESMQAMAELLKEGKIKAVGLSEASSDIIKRANRKLLSLTSGVHQVSAVQSEYSLLSRNVEANGVLQTCRELNITFVAYSPLSRALLTGEINKVENLDDGDFRKTLPRFQEENLVFNNKIVETVNLLAQKKKCTSAQIALAWVMHQPNVVPIPGTTKIKHLLSNIESENIILDEMEIMELNNLNSARGFRYAEAAMKAYGFDDEMHDEKYSKLTY